MKLENEVIEELNAKQINNNESIHIYRSIIKTIDFDLNEFDHEVYIEGCIIDNFLIHSCWFKKGLILANNQFIKYIDYQMGGHNQTTIKISGNIFNEFFNFFDCHFEGPVEIENNIFLRGSNLKGNETEGFCNTFDQGINEKNNLGEIDLNGLGR